MDDSRRGKLVAVAIALLLPLTFEQSVYVFGRQATPRAQFYAITACGAVAIAVGMKAAVPILCSGLFFGGVLTIVKNYYYNWGQLDDMTRLITLLIALGAMVFLTMRKAGRGSKRSSSAARGGRRRK
jgi:hypothetical protein